MNPPVAPPIASSQCRPAPPDIRPFRSGFDHATECLCPSVLWLISAGHSSTTGPGPAAWSFRAALATTEKGGRG